MTLQEAADALSVHYMTAYRYVRLGLLHAEKVGGSWRVDTADLDEFRERRSGKLVVGAEAVSGWSPRSVDAPWADRFESRLVAGDLRGAWGVVEAAMSAGRNLDSIYLEVISPAMVSIGERWERDDIDVALEHRASGIAMRIIGQLGHRFTRRGRVRGAVVVATPAGETHAIPTAIVSDLLRIRGWEVSDLGADVPPESLIAALDAETDVRAVGLSVTSAENLESAADSCVLVRRKRPEVKIVVGGLALDGADAAADLGADAYAATGIEMHELLDEWFPLSRLKARDEGRAAGG